MAAEVTVTIKYGKGYEETWAVFRGTVQEVREMVIDYFGITPDAITELSTHELVINVTNLAHGTGNVAAMLGGTVIAAPVTAAPAITGGNPWEGLEENHTDSNAMDPILPPQEKPNAWLYPMIADSTTVDELRRLYATHSTILESDADVKAAWSARGKELSTK